MNANITNMISDFAKINKVSKIKVENLVLEALKASGALKTPKKKGRKSMGIDVEIENMVKNFEVFTVRDIMVKFSVSRPTAMNALTKCVNRGTVAAITKDSTWGRGRKDVVWGIPS